jgi:hypothetical protein
MAQGNPMNYGFYEDMNTVAFLNLLNFKISQSKEEKRKQKLHEMKMKSQHG